MSKHELINEQTLDAMAADLGRDVSEQLVVLFVTELQTLTHTLREALPSRDFDAITEVAHILKNSAELYGAHILAERFRNIHDNREATESEILSQGVHLLELCVETATAFESRQKINLEGKKE